MAVAAPQSSLIVHCPLLPSLRLPCPRDRRQGRDGRARQDRVRRPAHRPENRGTARHQVRMGGHVVHSLARPACACNLCNIGYMYNIPYVSERDCVYQARALNPSIPCSETTVQSSFHILRLPPMFAERQAGSRPLAV